MNDKPTVMLGTLIRNSAWILKEFLEHVRSLTYDKRKMDLVFVVNDSIDESEKMLHEFANEHRLEYNKLIIAKHDFGANAIGWGSSRLNEEDPCARRGGAPQERTKLFSNLAILRNALLSIHKQHSEAEWFFSVDSDILVEPETLDTLIADGSPKMRSALIVNDWLTETHTRFELNHRSTNAGVLVHAIDGRHAISHFFNYRLGSVHRIDLTGACFAIPKSIAGMSNYGYHEWGEDAAFCLGLPQGTIVEFDTRTIPFHAMNQELLRRRGEFEIVRELSRRQAA